MIVLHGFGKSFGVNDPSPFVMKVDAYCRFAGIDYEVDNASNNLRNAPKGKLPFIKDNGRVIADSQLILQYLIEQYGDRLDKGLSANEKGQSYLITKSLDENLYFCLVYSRWLCNDTWPLIKKEFFGFLPPVVKSIVPLLIRRTVNKSLKGQGLARHSHQDILDICQQSFSALSDMLSDKLFLFGDSPSSLDATCYGHIAEFIMTDIQNPFNHMAKTFTNLVNYCNRINQQYY